MRTVAFVEQLVSETSVHTWLAHICLVAKRANYFQQMQPSKCRVRRTQYNGDELFAAFIDVLATLIPMEICVELLFDCWIFLQYDWNYIWSLMQFYFFLLFYRVWFWSLESLKWRNFVQYYCFSFLFPFCCCTFDTELRQLRCRGHEMSMKLLLYYRGL